jgi:hypothetical protein
MSLTTSEEMVDMPKSLIEQGCDVGVEELVDHVTSTSVTDDETQISQYSQLVGDGRLFHLHLGAQIANRARPGSKPSEDPDSAGGG